MLFNQIPSDSKNTGIQRAAFFYPLTPIINIYIYPSKSRWHNPYFKEEELQRQGKVK